MRVCTGLQHFENKPFGKQQLQLQSDTGRENLVHVLFEDGHVDSSTTEKQTFVSIQLRNTGLCEPCMPLKTTSRNMFQQSSHFCNTVFDRLS